MRTALHALTDELRRLKTAGVKTVAVSAESVAALRRIVQARARGGSAAALLDTPEPAASVLEPRAAAVPLKAYEPPVPVYTPKPALKPVAELLPPPPTVSLPPGDKQTRWNVLLELVRNDATCKAHVRPGKKVVLGAGSVEAQIMFVGEAPGEEEDLRGEPFIGKAGQLLTKIIGAMEFSREEIFIANVLKCRPDMPAGESGNRKPKPAEMATCLPWLTEQIGLIKPTVIVALGLTAVEGLLGEPRTMRDVRGKWLDYHGVPLMPTYHPAYLLRNQTLAEKRKVWEDMLLVLEKLGRPISAKQRGYFLEKGQ